MNISNLIASYGYWAVFLLVAVESLGIPASERWVQSPPVPAAIGREPRSRHT